MRPAGKELGSGGEGERMTAPGMSGKGRFIALKESKYLKGEKFSGVVWHFSVTQKILCPTRLRHSLENSSISKQVLLIKSDSLEIFLFLNFEV